MSRHTVAYLITHSRAKNFHAPVFQFSLKFTFETQNYMALFTPVIRQVARRVFNDSDANIAELSSPPMRNTVFPCMFGRFYR